MFNLRKVENVCDSHSRKDLILASCRNGCKFRLSDWRSRVFPCSNYLVQNNRVLIHTKFWMIRGSRVLSIRKWIHLTRRPGLCQHHVRPIPEQCRPELRIPDRNLTAVRVKYMLEKGLAQVSCGVLRVSLPAPFHERSILIPLSSDWWKIAHLNAAVSHR
jgi:hypothetical protein